MTLKHYKLLDKDCFVIVDSVEHYTNHTVNEFTTQISQVRFSSGTKISNVTACGSTAPYLEPGTSAEFHFYGDEKGSNLIAVRTNDEEFIEVDDNVYRNAYRQARVVAWTGLLAGIPMLVVAVGIFSIAASIYYFNVASRFSGILDLSEALKSRMKVPEPAPIVVPQRPTLIDLAA